MKCPVCDNVTMREVEKSGIMIDVCPDCKGVWLDRGELDKLMGGVREIREEFNQWQDKSGYPSRDHEKREYHSIASKSDPYYKKKKKKENILDMFGDLFG